MALSSVPDILDDIRAGKMVILMDDEAAELGLEAGEEYQLKLFFAERHTSESNFRIETNFVLKPAKLPVISSLAD